MFKKGFLIDLDVEPKTDEDICLEVAKYWGNFWEPLLRCLATRSY